MASVSLPMEKAGRERSSTPNPRAALCFHWKSLRRQVRVEGRVTAMPDADVDQYFRTRSRNSQIGAAVSQQSRPLDSREELEPAFANLPRSMREKSRARPTGAASAYIQSRSNSGSAETTAYTTGSYLPAMLEHGEQPGCTHSLWSVVAEGASPRLFRTRVGWGERPSYNTPTEPVL